MPVPIRLTALLAASLAVPGLLLAQEDTTAEPTQEQPIAEETTAPESDLLTDAELQTLVAPVALYPDTLLIQILVGATVPFDVMKADRLLLENVEASADDMKPVIEAQGYDPSVEVMATAFPDVVHEMAEHIDWTETVGDAMLVQSDDVMDAVQVMRDQAINTGALVSNEQQTVTEDPDTQTVIVQPADPEVVYVPQYDAEAVYDPGFSAGDAIAAGLITWGTFALIDEIFDDDDDWDDYWGCRNCAGWGGGPIIRDPDIDIDIDGNVNVGNDIEFDRDDIRNRIDTGDIKVDNDELRNRIETGDIDRDEFRNRVNSGDITIEDNDLRARLEDRDGGWTPDQGQRDEARDKISNARGEGGATTLPIERPATDSTDALRSKLSDRTGAQDISRPEGGLSFGDSVGAVAAGGAAGALAGAAANRPQAGGGNANVDKLKAKAPAKKPVAKPAAKKKPAAKPKVSKPAANVKRPAPKAAKAAPKIAKKSSGNRAKAAGKRGKKGGPKRRR